MMKFNDISLRGKLVINFLLSGGVLTLSARRTDSAGQATVTLKIDLRSGTLLP